MLSQVSVFSSHKQHSATVFLLFPELITQHCIFWVFIAIWILMFHLLTVAKGTMSYVCYVLLNSVWLPRIDNVLFVIVETGSHTIIHTGLKLSIAHTDLSLVAIFLLQPVLNKSLIFWPFFFFFEIISLSWNSLCGLELTGFHL